MNNEDYDAELDFAGLRTFAGLVTIKHAPQVKFSSFLRQMGLQVNIVASTNPEYPPFSAELSNGTPCVEGRGDTPRQALLSLAHELRGRLVRCAHKTFQCHRDWEPEE